MVSYHSTGNKLLEVDKDQKHEADIKENVVNISIGLIRHRGLL
jgi:hypothetical protein